MTPERIEQECKAFEKWYASTYLPTPVHGRTFNKYPTGVYCLQHVQDAWQAWQARAAQSEWISAKDKLPEEKSRYLTCYVGSVARVCQFDGKNSHIGNMMKKNGIL